MKVSIDFVEKKLGMIRKTTLHGVTLSVTFSNAELAIIEERKLKNDLILEREIPADVDPAKLESRGIAKRLATAAVGGNNHFHLTFAKLIKGPDTYYMETPAQAKSYVEDLKGALTNAKGWIEGNAEVGASTSFEL